MNQDMITLIVVSSAVAYTFYALAKLILSLRQGNQKQQRCMGCTGCFFHEAHHTGYPTRNAKL